MNTYYSKEATKNNYAEFIINYDLNKMINKFADNLADDIRSDVEYEFMENLERAQSCIKDALDYLY